MDKVTRRSFVTTVGAATWLLPGLRANARANPTPVASLPATPQGYRFFDANEAQFIEAACERLIPADDSRPGAMAAGVPRYLDVQLSGNWGAGKQLFRGGPWQPGTAPTIVLPFTPAALFRSALRAINRDQEKRGVPFAELPCGSQDALLVALQSGEALLEGAPAAVFFDLLLKMTVEGFFSHPQHGLTRDRVAWRLNGFPGAHAAS